jgi:hypothetical protein
MKQNSSCESYRSSAIQEIPPIFKESGVSLLFSKEATTCHYTEADKFIPCPIQRP